MNTTVMETASSSEQYVESPGFLQLCRGMRDAYRYWHLCRRIAAAQKEMRAGKGIQISSGQEFLDLLEKV